MKNKDKMYFSALHQRRLNLASAIDDPALSGIKDIVVDKYSDQAHFIYELLQNADDTKATYARFVLRPHELLFAHNGSRHFTISDPQNEKVDKLNGCLGDMNSITSIGSSSKGSSNTIGKFGIGFKAVFQYTTTPEIYDPNFSFKIEEFIVPTEIGHDHPERKHDETLFVFPFNHPNRPYDVAYDDISDKLRSLIYPILFLNNLRSITFEFDGTIGLYGKEILEVKTFGDITGKLLCLSQNEGEDIKEEKLWLFARANENGHNYCVGFFLDDEGHLTPKSETAFCFFPTKEVTQLNFIIHAPFILNSSRETILAADPYNRRLISLLAELAADSLLCLRDIGLESKNLLITDNIINIIPISESDFNDENDRRRISFRPFYTKISEVFKTKDLLPSGHKYVSKPNAYWAATPGITKIIGNKQLQQLCGNPRARWVFKSIGRSYSHSHNIDLTDYIEDITCNCLDDDDILRGWEDYDEDGDYDYVSRSITPEFTEQQSIEWLHKFYKWISASSSRVNYIRSVPIFLDQRNKAAAAFDSSNHPILFLPSKHIKDCRTISKALLENEETQKLLDTLKIKEPSLRDEIYSNILPCFKKKAHVDLIECFKLFFQYYCECSRSESSSFIEMIKDCDFIYCYKNGDDTSYRAKSHIMYYPTSDILKYLTPNTEEYILDLDKYKDIVDPDKHNLLDSFFTELGVLRDVQVTTYNVSKSDVDDLKLRWQYYNHYSKWEEPYIDGCESAIESIIKNKDKDLSVIMWTQLINIARSKCRPHTYWSRQPLPLSHVLNGRYYYRPDGRYNPTMVPYESHDMRRLRNQSWLLNTDGQLVSASDITRETLSSLYSMDDQENVDLVIDFLGIKSVPELSREERTQFYSRLPKEEQDCLDIAKQLQDAGITSAEGIAEFIRFQKAKQSTTIPGTSVSSNSDRSRYSYESDFSEDHDNPEDESGSNVSNKSTHRLSSSKRRIIDEITERTRQIQSASLPVFEFADEFDMDEDEFTRPPVDYKKKVEQAMQKQAREVDRIAHLNELQSNAQDAERYSFAWFRNLLEMESINSNESNSNSKEISISFAKVELEEGTSRTLILKHPNRYIPQFMEDLADIPLVLHTKDQTRKVAIEVASVRSYTLRVKLKSYSDLDELDLSKVIEARIDAQNPVFILEELRKQFLALDFKDDYNLQANLPPNISFVFGPPGTGKTTYLGRKVLTPLMKDPQPLKILVLTPTNKAADVLVKRIMTDYDSVSDKSYEDWLVRFGSTGDESIEESPVYKEKTFDIRQMRRNVTVTTIARFPYDYFMPSNSRLFLHALNWDYIVIDEASMISLANIVYPIFKKTPKKFIIAGDPFQIEPITSVELWKNENIYTMVGLKSFTDPKTYPYDYEVKLLTTQYRSVPLIGDIFSKFTYGGILKHHRDSNSQKKLVTKDFIDFDALNIIKFPVSKYESIFKSKRLQKSNYHIYSAIFSAEFVSHLSQQIINPTFKIGVIAAYRAQADLIDKLLAAFDIPKNIEVQVGTIHGFQGDECDMIIAVFNPPPGISRSKDMFLNKKNIINVAISRACDYLVIVMPDDLTENVENLWLVKRVEGLIKQQDSYGEYNSELIEDIMFGSETYIEDNSFTTSHQNVNVYGLPERKYEIRSEESAIDIQVHKIK